MNKLISIFFITLLMLSACSPTTRVSEKVEKSDSLAATMRMQNHIKTGSPITLTFTVNNLGNHAKQFCKWHTPFEPLMSMYLQITDANGEEAAYQGPMAKRIMPPPVESYINVNPSDSLSIDVDVLKAYSITKPGTYTVKYVGQNMSGLAVKDSVVFVYGE